MEDLKETKVAADTEVETEENKEPQGKFYTDEEIERLKNQEADRRITQYQKTLERKKREADKLRNMSEEDKRNYELDLREQQIEAKEKEIALLENKSAGISVLAEKGLDSKLIDFVIDEDGEKMYENIKTIEKLFKASVKAEVEKRLGSSAPKRNLENSDSITKADFNKMSLSEQQRLYRESPEIYKSLV